jgi:hypothetical protein
MVLKEGNKFSNRYRTSADLAALKARINAAVKNINALMLTRVWQEPEYRIDVCYVTCGAYIKHL